MNIAELSINVNGDLKIVGSKAEIKALFIVLTQKLHSEKILSKKEIEDCVKGSLKSLEELENDKKEIEEQMKKKKEEFEKEFNNFLSELFGKC